MVMTKLKKEPSKNQGAVIERVENLNALVFISVLVALVALLAYNTIS